MMPVEVQDTDIYVAYVRTLEKGSRVCKRCNVPNVHGNGYNKIRKWENTKKLKIRISNVEEVDKFTTFEE